ncbi:hypothetical protein [Arenivirga flava]|uniref:Uncharacterized protein n=1 Tax=Arenivirga flava TaxID=1930060 RepID=A0AA37UCQ8_9MICO|nr:hypothetical protein [Arenivirga flava]GMA26869.1 hypothetical protein GCM10025874_01220 [Arenivirga flava]
MSLGIDESTLTGVGGRTGVGRRRVRTRSTIAARRVHSAGVGSASPIVLAAIICGLQVVFGVAVLVANWSAHPLPLLAAAAWAVLLFAEATLAVIVSYNGERLPNGLFVFFLVALGTAVLLDLVSIWSVEDLGGYASASIGAGFALLLTIAQRSRREIVIAVAVLGAVLLGAILATTPLTTATLPAQLIALCLACLPAVIGLVVVGGFRAIVQRALDRVLVQSTIAGPRLAFGMLASEELARLDAAAEEMLESVADGRRPLPLDPASASRAATIATELRLHLLDGRKQTWLYHAVSESEVLGPTVRLSDPHTLAGLLDQHQRDGLLTAVWLLSSELQRSGISITLGPVRPQDADAANGRLVPIVVEVEDSSRGGVDPATWDELSKVGTFRDSVRQQVLRVEIDCWVADPAEP